MSGKYCSLLNVVLESVVHIKTGSQDMVAVQFDHFGRWTEDGQGGKACIGDSIIIAYDEGLRRT